MNRFYAKLKYRLLPYIYTTVHQGSATGLPALRAMVMDNENNPGFIPRSIRNTCWATGC